MEKKKIQAPYGQAAGRDIRIEAAPAFDIQSVFGSGALFCAGDIHVHVIGASPPCASAVEPPGQQHSPSQPNATGPEITPKRTATPAQSEVLALMRDHPTRRTVLRFMQQHFGTELVIDLDDAQLRRVRGYINGIRRNQATRHNKEES